MMEEKHDLPGCVIGFLLCGVICLILYTGSQSDKVITFNSCNVIVTDIVGHEYKGRLEIDENDVVIYVINKNIKNEIKPTMSIPVRIKHEYVKSIESIAYKKNGAYNDAD